MSPRDDDVTEALLPVRDDVDRDVIDARRRHGSTSEVIDEDIDDDNEDQDVDSKKRKKTRTVFSRHQVKTAQLSLAIPP